MKKLIGLIALLMFATITAPMAEATDLVYTYIGHQCQLNFIVNNYSARTVNVTSSASIAKNKAISFTGVPPSFPANTDPAFQTIGPGTLNQPFTALYVPMGTTDGLTWSQTFSTASWNTTGSIVPGGSFVVEMYTQNKTYPAMATKWTFKDFETMFKFASQLVSDISDIYSAGTGGLLDPTIHSTRDIKEADWDKLNFSDNSTTYDLINSKVITQNPMLKNNMTNLKTGNGLIGNGWKSLDTGVAMQGVVNAHRNMKFSAPVMLAARVLPEGQSSPPQFGNGIYEDVLVTYDNTAQLIYEVRTIPKNDTAAEIDPQVIINIYEPSAYFSNMLFATYNMTETSGQYAYRDNFSDNLKAIVTGGAVTTAGDINWSDTPAQQTNYQNFANAVLRYAEVLNQPKMNKSGSQASGVASFSNVMAAIKSGDKTIQDNFVQSLLHANPFLDITGQGVVLPVYTPSVLSGYTDEDLKIDMNTQYVVGIPEPILRTRASNTLLGLQRMAAASGNYTTDLQNKVYGAGTLVTDPKIWNAKVGYAKQARMLLRRVFPYYSADIKSTIDSAITNIAKQGFSVIEGYSDSALQSDMGPYYTQITDPLQQKRARNAVADLLALPSTSPDYAYASQMRLKLYSTMPYYNKTTDFAIVNAWITDMWKNHGLSYQLGYTDSLLLVDMEPFYLQITDPIKQKRARNTVADLLVQAKTTTDVYSVTMRQNLYNTMPYYNKTTDFTTVSAWVTDMWKNHGLGYVIGYNDAQLTVDSAAYYAGITDQNAKTLTTNTINNMLAVAGASGIYSTDLSKKVVGCGTDFTDQASWTAQVNYARTMRTNYYNEMPYYSAADNALIDGWVTDMVKNHKLGYQPNYTDANLTSDVAKKYLAFIKSSDPAKATLYASALQDLITIKNTASGNFATDSAAKLPGTDMTSKTTWAAHCQDAKTYYSQLVSVFPYYANTNTKESSQVNALFVSIVTNPNGGFGTRLGESAIYKTVTNQNLKTYWTKMGANNLSLTTQSVLFAALYNFTNINNNFNPQANPTYATMSAADKQKAALPASLSWYPGFGPQALTFPTTYLSPYQYWKSLPANSTNSFNMNPKPVAEPWSAMVDNSLQRFNLWSSLIADQGDPSSNILAMQMILDLPLQGYLGNMTAQNSQALITTLATFAGAQGMTAADCDYLKTALNAIYTFSTEDPNKIDPATLKAFNTIQSKNYKPVDAQLRAKMSWYDILSFFIPYSIQDPNNPHMPAQAININANTLTDVTMLTKLPPYQQTLLMAKLQAFAQVSQRTVNHTWLDAIANLPAAIKPTLTMLDKRLADTANSKLVIDSMDPSGFSTADVYNVSNAVRVHGTNEDRRTYDPYYGYLYADWLNNPDGKSSFSCVFPDQVNYMMTDQGPEEFSGVTSKYENPPLPYFQQIMSDRAKFVNLSKNLKFVDSGPVSQWRGQVTYARHVEAMLGAYAKGNRTPATMTTLEHFWLNSLRKFITSSDVGSLNITTMQDNLKNFVMNNGYTLVTATKLTLQMNNMYSYVFGSISPTPATGKYTLTADGTALQTAIAQAVIDYTELYADLKQDSGTLVNVDSSLQTGKAPAIMRTLGHILNNNNYDKNESDYAGKKLYTQP
ncbi:MAG: hypothetical protein WCP79_00750 [Bacillota bacterium]